MPIEFPRSPKPEIRKNPYRKKHEEPSCAPSHPACTRAKLNISNNSEKLKMLQRIMIEIETDWYDELSLNSLTSKWLQNNVVNLFCSQQKLSTSRLIAGPGFHTYFLTRPSTRYQCHDPARILDRISISWPGSVSTSSRVRIRVPDPTRQAIENSGSNYW